MISLDEIVIGSIVVVISISIALAEAARSVLAHFGF
jgi:hypothetical protein